MNTRKKTISLTKLLILGLVNILLASVFIFSFEAITTESEKKEELFQKLNSVKTSYTTSFTDQTTFTALYMDLFDQEAKALVYAHNNVDDFVVTEGIKNAFSSSILHINPSQDLLDNKNVYYDTSEDGTTYALEYTDDTMSIVKTTVDWSSDTIINDIVSNNDLIIVTDKDGRITFYPSNEKMEGKNISTLGFKLSDLKPEDTVNLKIKDGNYYTAASFDETHELMYIYGVKSHIFNANNRICAAVICAAMFIVVNMIVAYSYFSRQETYSQLNKGDQPVVSKRKNPMIIGIIGLVVITIITFHIQSLFSLSVFSMQKNNEKMMIETLVDRHSNRFVVATVVNDFMNDEKAAVIDALLESYPQLRTKDSLLTLKSIFDVPFIHLYDAEMTEIASTDDYVDQYKDYENTPIFNLNMDYAITDDQIKDFEKDALRENKTAIKGDDGNSYYVTVGFPLKIYDPIVDQLDLITVLKNISVARENEVTAIDPETMTVLYSTLSYYTGFDASNMGLTPEDMHNNSLNKIDLDGKNYYSSSYRLENKFVFLMQEASIMFDGRTDMVLAVAIVSTLCIAISLYILSRHNVVPLSTENEEEKKFNTLNSVYTFFEINDHWSTKSAEEKALTIAKVIFHVLSFIVIGIILFRNSMTDDNTIFGFVVQDKWAKGFNIFSITAVTVVCFIYNFIITIVNFLFRKMYKVVSPKSETILRLVQSFIIYGTMLALLFYCLYLMGLDPASLLASAGLAGFVISLGAKDLITDILAGLFIIFENQFQVGDMIEVGSDMGTVMEIGVRTTRLRTIPGDILCIGNRNLSNVVNKTRLNTSTSLVLAVSYKQNIPAIENMLREELPKLQNLSPKLINGPVYQGIYEFTDRYAKMFVNFTTKEQDRFVVTTMMNTELCRLFDEHGFQMGIKPIEYKK